MHAAKENMSWFCLLRKFKRVKRKKKQFEKIEMNGNKSKTIMVNWMKLVFTFKKKISITLKKKRWNEDKHNKKKLKKKWFSILKEWAAQHAQDYPMILKSWSLRNRRKWTLHIVKVFEKKSKNIQINNDLFLFHRNRYD